MYLFAFAFLLGIMSITWLSSLPKLSTVLLLQVFLITGLLMAPAKIATALRFGLFFSLGCLFFIFEAQKTLAWSLPQQLEGKMLLVTGSIISLPKIQNDSVNYLFHVKTFNNIVENTNILLSWHNLPPNIHLNTNDWWQFQVHLKRPHGLLNPGGFDYEQWLFSQKIRATGYVVTSPNNKLLHPENSFFSVTKLRQTLQEKLQHCLGDLPTAGLVMALIMGSQEKITLEQWEVMRATGTNHLMAIAGVHIGFVAGFFYLLTQFLWRRSEKLLLCMPAQNFATLTALLAALVYSIMAGFSLPTQRALIMLSTFSLGVFLRREISAWNAFTLAGIIILIIDPFATLSISFWLSFAAVFAILYGIHGRIDPKGLWWKYGRVQWVITVGLVPISLLLFKQTSLISFIANFVAVPAVGILVLPLCLTGAFLLLISEKIATPLLLLAAKMLSYIWEFLKGLSQLPDAVWQQSIANPWIFFTSVIGVLLLIAPKGFPGRWLGVIFLLPLLFYRAPIPKYGECWLTLLDVGQGLSAVVRTQNHTLIFDAGPKMGETEDAGQRVILPFLHNIQREKLDILIISHGDSDHIGGAFSILKQMPVTQILTSAPEKISDFNKQLCQAGQKWQWDGVLFQVLSPTAEIADQNNNSSCVLRVEINNHAILLTGDIEKSTEKYLLQKSAISSADVLIAPHHGSQTSSTPEFIQAIQAKYVLFPVGYKNRYHLPSPLVVQRYKETQATLLYSAQDGAIEIKMRPSTGVYAVKKWRQENKKIWHDTS